MTSEAVRKWLIALLKANPGTAALSSSVMSVRAGKQPDKIPPGNTFAVYTRDDTREEQYGDSVDVTVTCYTTNGEVVCYQMVNAVHAALLGVGGIARTWSADPASSGLKLKSVRRVSTPQPEQDGETATSFACVSVYEIKGQAA